MEIRVVIFLALVSIAAITNALLMLCAYKAFAGMTATITTTMAELGRSGQISQGIETLRISAEQAASATEAARQSMAQIDPRFSRVQESYNRALAKVDSRLDEVAYGIEVTTRKVKDVVATPAVSIVAFAAGLSNVFEKTEDK
jgi:phosphoenolpyruvate carboxylase